MSDNNIENVIKVENIKKVYRMYEKPTDRLKDALGLAKHKKFADKYALNGVSFNVNKGETVGIIGTNGSGKSTILKIITGVLQPTEGNIEINGRISALLELGAGFNMEFTGIENVYLNGTMIGYTKEEIDEKLENILSFADIGDYVYQPVKTYSSGMFVRLAFAVAINIDPEILIVDEALSVGDVFFQAKCYKKFEEFKKQGKTILFVSHDLGSIGKYCDRVILLNQGDLVAEGKPKEIVDLYKRILVKQQDDGKTKIASGAQDGWKANYAQNPDALEYGDKRAEIVDYAVVDDKGEYTNTIMKFSDFTIKYKVHFNEDIADPIFAFTFKDIKGTEITGTNTMYEKVHFDDVKAGEDKIVEFKQNMNLQGGEYLLSMGVKGFEKDEFFAYHRLYAIITINRSA